MDMMSDIWAITALALSWSAARTAMMWFSDMDRCIGLGMKVCFWPWIDTTANIKLADTCMEHKERCVKVVPYLQQEVIEYTKAAVKPAGKGSCTSLASR